MQHAPHPSENEDSSGSYGWQAAPPVGRLTTVGVGELTVDPEDEE